MKDQLVDEVAAAIAQEEASRAVDPRWDRAVAGQLGREELGKLIATLAPPDRARYLAVFAPSSASRREQLAERALALLQAQDGLEPAILQQQSCAEQISLLRGGGSRAPGAQTRVLAIRRAGAARRVRLWGAATAAVVAACLAGVWVRSSRTEADLGEAELLPVFALELRGDQAAWRGSSPADGAKSAETHVRTGGVRHLWPQSVVDLTIRPDRRVSGELALEAYWRRAGSPWERWPVSFEPSTTGAFHVVGTGRELFGDTRGAVDLAIVVGRPKAVTWLAVEQVTEQVTEQVAERVAEQVAGSRLGAGCQLLREHLWLHDGSSPP